MGRVPGQRPLWTSYDRAVAEAWLEWQDLRCGGCGHPRDEAWTRDADGHWTSERRQCRVCAAIEKGQDAYRRETGPQGTSTPLPGLKVLAVQQSQ